MYICLKAYQSKYLTIKILNTFYVSTHIIRNVISSSYATYKNQTNLGKTLPHFMLLGPWVQKNIFSPQCNVLQSFG